MAAWRDLSTAGKTLVVLGSGAAAAALSFAVWRKLRQRFTDDKDEGFVDVSKVCQSFSWTLGPTMIK